MKKIMRMFNLKQIKKAAIKPTNIFSPPRMVTKADRAVLDNARRIQSLTQRTAERDLVAVEDYFYSSKHPARTKKLNLQNALKQTTSLQVKERILELIRKLQ
jgi:hypothetical protein